MAECSPWVLCKWFVCDPIFNACREEFEYNDCVDGTQYMQMQTMIIFIIYIN